MKLKLFALIILPLVCGSSISAESTNLFGSHDLSEQSETVYDAVKVFNDCAPTYLKARENQFDNLQQLQVLAEKIAPIQSKRVLDLGCGGGTPVLKYFHERGAEIWGVDFAEKMLNHAKSTLPDAHLILEDITQINLPRNHFDLVLSFYTLFVLSLEEQKNVFKKIYDTLKTEGNTYFTLFGEEATHAKEFSGYLPFMGHTFYYAHTTPEKYRHILESIGFVDIEMQTIAIGPETCLWVYAKKGA